MLEKYNKTIQFYSLSLVLPWTLWFILAYMSHLQNQNSTLQIFQSVFGILGLVSPVFIAGFFS